MRIQHVKTTKNEVLKVIMLILNGLYLLQSLAMLKLIVMFNIVQVVLKMLGIAACCFKLIFGFSFHTSGHV